MGKCAAGRFGRPAGTLLKLALNGGLENADVGPDVQIAVAFGLSEGVQLTVASQTVGAGPEECLMGNVTQNKLCNITRECKSSLPSKICLPVLDDL